ncbi:MAG: HlyD family efflux transporter periplasmic adaptor subunit [Anaerocolumna sp.]
MGRNTKITKYRKPININVGVIIFLIIFIYIIISICVYFTKDHLSIYEVNRGYTADDYKFNGLIFREEEVVKTNMAGYVNYFHKDGDRVAKNSIIYAVNEKNESNELVTSSDNALAISKEETLTIKSEILDFHKNYDSGDFFNVYTLKAELQNSALQVMSDSQLASLDEIQEGNGSSDYLDIVRTNASGIVTYNIDDYENLSLETATAGDLSPEEYIKTQLRSTDLVSKNSPVYKIITSEDWHILLLLDENQYETLEEVEKATITFTEDGLKLNVPISVYQKGSDYFAKIDMDKYMEKYLDRRFISLEITTDTAKGLKIPVSSITEKAVYQIPKEYFTAGGDSNSEGLVKEEKTLVDGEVEVSYTFIPTDIYYSDDTYKYVNGLLFEPGDIIQEPITQKRYEIGKSETLKGVFNINKGYAVFRRIEILMENEEYCIVKEGTSYGLSVYDHIALDASTATEQAIIY